MISLNRKIIFFSILIIIYTCAWVMQSHIFLKGDLSWQLHLAHSVLRGGNYISQFFEINPPLSIFLYMPEILLEKMLFVSRVIGLRLYIFLCATVSIYICYHLSKKAFSDKDVFQRFLFLLSLPIIYLILPVSEFGQRENLFVILTVPYFLLLACRLRNQFVSTSFSFSIGIMAAIGFCLKPFFLICFAFVEYYTIRKVFVKKRLLNKNNIMKIIKRPEIIVIVFFILFYLLLIYFFFKPYLFSVLPIATTFYYQAFSDSLRKLIISPVVLYCFMSYALYFYNYQSNKKQVVNTLFIFALTGCVMSYFMQKIAWYYHAIPLFSIATLMNVLLLTSSFEKARTKTISLFLSGLVSLCLFVFFFSIIVLLYMNASRQKKNMDSLVFFLHKTSLHKPIYFFSAHAAYMVSVFEHAGVQHASRLQFLFWMRNYYKKDILQKLTAEQKNDDVFFMTMLSDDVKKNKPELIFVDTFCAAIDSGHCMRIQYLQFFNKKKDFQSIWRSYRFLTSIRKKNVYSFDIYVFNKDYDHYTASLNGMFKRQQFRSVSQ